MRIVCGAALGVVLLAGVVVVGAELTDDRRSPPASASASASRAGGLPADGDYRIRVGAPGQCLSEIPGRADGRLYPRPCAQTFPPMSLDRLDDGTYRIRTQHPQYGPGCLAVDDVGAEPVGAPVSDSTCGERATEILRLEPVRTPINGYRIRPVHSGLCLAVDAITESVRQLRCAPGSTSEVFVFLPR